MHIVNTVFGSARGGRWQVLVDYSRWLIEEGHTVTVIIGTKATEPTEELNLLGCNIIRIANSGFYDPVATLRIWKLLRKIKPDAILSHGGRSTSYFKRVKSRKIPLISINHSNNVKRTLGSDAFFDISDHIQQLIEGMPGSGLHYRVVNCPRELTVQVPRENLQTVRLAYLGQLIERKGVDILIRALALMREKKMDFTCAIAGSGEEREKLESLTEQLGLTQFISFVGQIENPVGFLANSDIFCFPTRGEGFPISPIEAFAAGCAVVGTDDPGTAELLEYGELGIVVKRDSVEDFAAALEKLINAPRLRVAIAEKAQARYLERYTPKKAKECFLAALGNCVSDFSQRTG